MENYGNSWKIKAKFYVAVVSLREKWSGTVL
jgi:hypothetical protein